MIRSKHTYITLGIVISLMVAGVANVASALQFQTDTSGDNAVKLDFTFGETINITLPNDTITISDLTPGTSKVSGSTYVVTVNTNAQGGYTLSATVGCGSDDTGFNSTCFDSTELKNGTNTFAMITSDGALSAGKWGIALVDTETVSSFKTLAKYNTTPTVLKQTNVAGGGSTPFRIGAQATNSQEAGTYKNRINFTAVTNLPLSYIQDLTLEQCQVNVGQGSNAANVGDEITVYDKRDGSDYTVRYINGACWMTQNLRFTNTSVPSATSNVTVDKTMTYYDLATNGTSGGRCYYTTGYSNACIKDSGNTTKGVWYNYYAATAGTISGSSNSNNASQDICPKNWHLPTGPNTTSGTDFNKLFNDTTSGYHEVAGLADAFLPAVGGIYSNGSLDGAEFGYWWSATASSTVARYRLVYNSSNGRFLGDNGYSDRYFGIFIRCVRSS